MPLKAFYTWGLGGKPYRDPRCEELFFMRYKLEFTEEEFELLSMGLRYLELNHMGEAADPRNNEIARKNFRTAFMKLLNDINSQVTQTTLFKE